MKNLKCIVLFCCLSSLSAFSQFTLTKDGFTASDSDKNYIVYEFKDKSKEELFTSTLKTITLKYKSAKDVVSKVENETISIRGVERSKIGKGKLFGKYTEIFPFSYNLSISFKNGKIKIDAPIVTFLESVKGRDLHLTKGGFGRVAIFKNGKLKQVEIKNDLESFFNTIVSQIKNGIEGNEEDW